MNERGRVVSFLRIHILDFRYSALPVCGGGAHRFKGRTVRGTSDQEKMYRDGTYRDASSWLHGIAEISEKELIACIAHAWVTWNLVMLEWHILSLFRMRLYMTNKKLIGYFIQKMKGHVEHVLYAYVIFRALTRTMQCWRSGHRRYKLQLEFAKSPCTPSQKKFYLQFLNVYIFNSNLM